MTSQLSLTCQIEHPVERLRTASLTALPVNEQSVYTWLPKTTLDTIGVVGEKEITFLTDQNQRLTRRSGFVILRVGKSFTIDEVIFAERGDPCWLGKRSLLGLHLVYDPAQQKLRPAPPSLVALINERSHAPKNMSLGRVARRANRIKL